MLKHDQGDDGLLKHAPRSAAPISAAAPAKQARPARRRRQIVTLEALNAASSPAPDFDDLDFASLDEPRTPEKWY